MVENDLKGATVLGHSMGGKIAMTIALTEPELIGRLIIADIAPVKYNHDNLSIIVALESINLSSVTSRSDADKLLMEKIPEQILRSFLLQNLVRSENQYEWRINISVLKAGLPNLHGFPAFSEKVFFAGPTLFLAGARSDFIEPNHHQEITRLFPKSSVIKIANAGHWLHADNPEVFLQSVMRFMQP